MISKKYVAFRENDIGRPGAAGFGVGICPAEYLALHPGFTPLPGYNVIGHANYGNYQYADGSIMCWIPRCYYKYGTGDNGLPVNIPDIKSIYDFATSAEAEAEGYAQFRADIDGGVEQPGFMYDKYKCSKNVLGAGFVASSIKNGLPISTHADHNPIADLTACDSNNYYQAINAAHARDGVDGAINPASIFHCASRFQRAKLAMLSLAHGNAAASTANCAYYQSGKSYPKGCNDNALRDTDDASVLYVSDGYSNCGKTGSGTLFAKTTHNGQDCGVADLNGLMWEVEIGATCIATTAAIEGMSQAAACEITWTGHGLTTGDFVMLLSIDQADWSGASDKLWEATVTGDDTFTIAFDSSGFATAYDAGTDPGTVAKGTFYAAKQATAMKDFTSGNSLATDHWGAVGVAAMMEEFTPPFVSGGFAQRFGNGANQVLSEAVDGAGWLLAGLGLPASSDGISSGGEDLFGKDYFYQYIRDQLCLVSGGYWSSGSVAGVWPLHWNYSRTYSSNAVGVRCAAYLL